MLVHKPFDGTRLVAITENPIYGLYRSNVTANLMACDLDDEDYKLIPDLPLLPDETIDNDEIWEAIRAEDRKQASNTHTRPLYE